MDLEFYNLYNTVNSYGKSVGRTLKKIDEELLQAVNSYGTSYLGVACSKKYNLSVAMLGLLQIYAKILYLSETALDDLMTKLDGLNRDSSPEREESSRGNSNSFALPSLKSVRSPEFDAVFVEMKSEITENEHSQAQTESEFSDTETLKGCFIGFKKETPDLEVSENVKSDTPSDSTDSDEPVQLLVNDGDVTEEGISVKFALPKQESEQHQRRTPAKERQMRESPNRENPPLKADDDSESKFTALAKLLDMNVHDRKREAEKKYEKNGAKTNFKWKTVSKSSSISSSTEKKHKETCPHYAIEDDVLTVDQLCNFCYIETPAEFYIRTNQQLFESLENSLNEDLNNQYQYVVGNYKSKQEAKDIVGSFGFVFLVNKRKWFRVEVLDWMDDRREEILIQLVDYGEKYFCRYQSLKCMTEFYSKFPKMAIRCHFAAIYSPESTNSWPQGSIDALIELSEMEKMTNFLVIYAHKEGNSYGVDLTKEHNGKTLSEILIENDLACQANVPEETFELEVVWEAQEECDNINEAITGYDAQDEARICPFTDDTGKCFKGPSCKLEHAKLSEDGITTDKTLTANRALAELALPSKGEKLEVLITGYINTCHFYVQFMRNRSSFNKYNDDFEKLLETMNSNNILQTYKPFKIYPGIGEIVVAKHNKAWYRAKCLENVEHDRVKVFMVDFGFTVTKKLTDIRQMSDDLLHLPFQAVECVLNESCEKSNVTPQVSWGFFENCMHSKYFMAHVIDTKEPLRLKLYDGKGMDMDYVLKNYGLGQDRDDRIYSDKECVLELS